MKITILICYVIVMLFAGISLTGLYDLVKRYRKRCKIRKSLRIDIETRYGYK